MNRLLCIGPRVYFGLIASIFPVTLFTASAIAQTFDEQFDHWPLHTTIKGTIIVDNKLADKSTLARRMRSADTPTVSIIADRNVSASELISLQLALPPNRAETTLTVFDHFDTGLIANRDTPADIMAIYLSRRLTTAEQQEFINSADSLHAQVNRGGTLIVNENIAPLICRSSICISDQSTTENPLNLFPDCAIDLEFDATDENVKRFANELEKLPRQVGIGLKPNTAMILDGREITLEGSGTACFVLPACEHLEMKTQFLAARQSRRRSNDQRMIDLTQWRRDSIDRIIDQFPPAKPETPHVENGTLVIVGGGGMPRGLINEFIELAGGKENARMVYVPCIENEDIGRNAGTVELWKRMGIKHATLVHTKDRNKANSDEAFLAPLKDATGIWFGGGRQWNLADSYYGTRAHQLMKEVLARGGVVGGSSAGASIQARFLARATPIGNTSILAPGYERGGLGFISGVAIDQHFSQRRRQQDMTQLVEQYPQLLGIGIDEATALIVQKSQGRITGNGRVYFYDRKRPVQTGEPDYIALPAGSIYDLAERKVIKDSSQDDSQ